MGLFGDEYEDSLRERFTDLLPLIDLAVMLRNHISQADNNF